MKRGMMAAFLVAGLGLGVAMAVPADAPAGPALESELVGDDQPEVPVGPLMTPAPDLLDESCGNSRCEPPEDCNTCPQDCGDCCGNRRCEPPEDCDSCPQDCC